MSDVKPKFDPSQPFQPVEMAKPKFDPSQPFQPGGGAEEQIVNEMPEGLTGRFLYKNLGNESEAGFNYLQKENPNFEFKKDKEGEVLARKKGTPVWGRLDPKGFDWRDVTDVAYDVPAGIVQGAATAGAGLLGTAAGGIGALPSAMAASAGSGAGLEAIRQGLGTWAGVNEGVNKSDVNMAGAFGLASPLLFGTGAGTKDVAKYAMKSGALRSAEDILASQRGLLGRGYDATMKKVGPRVAAVLGGYSPKTISSAAENLDFIKTLKDKPELGIQYIEDNQELFVNSMKQAGNEIGSKLGETASKLDALGGEVDTQKVLAPLLKLRENMANKGIQNEAKKESLAQVDNILAKYFAVGETTPLKLTTSEATDLANQLTELSYEYGLNFKNMGTTKSVQQGATHADKATLRALAGTVSSIKKEVGDVANTLSPELKAQMDNYNSLYSAHKELENEFFGATKTGESFQKFLKKGTLSADVSKKKMSEIAGKNIDKLAADLQAMELFRKPQWEIPSFGMSNTGRTATAAALGGLAGYSLGQESGGQYSPYVMGALGAMAGAKGVGPVMVRKYMEANQLMRQAPTKLPGYKYLPYLMMNAGDERK